MTPCRTRWSRRIHRIRRIRGTRLRQVRPGLLMFAAVLVGLLATWLLASPRPAVAAITGAAL